MPPLEPPKGLKLVITYLSTGMLTKIDYKTRAMMLVPLNFKKLRIPIHNPLKWNEQRCCFTSDETAGLNKRIEPIFK